MDTTRKIDTVEVGTRLVPGLFLTGWCLFFYADKANIISSAMPELPAGFGLILLFAASMFLGTCLTALAELLVPLFNFTFGGTPLEVASGGEDENYFEAYMPAASISRIASKIESEFGSESDLTCNFIIARELSKERSCGLLKESEILGQYYKTLVVLVLICCAIMTHTVYPIKGVQEGFWGGVLYTVIWGAVAGLFWHRARAKECQYVREVLLSAESVLDERKRTCALTDCRDDSKGAEEGET